MATRKISRCWFLLTLALLVPGGCGEDDGISPLQPTLANLWPNADGDAWTYGLEMTARLATGPGVFPVGTEVPPLPSREELVALLDAAPVGLPTDIGSGVMRLRFDGLLTTGSDVTAQNLTESYYSTYKTAGALRVLDGGEIFLRRLARARPDLAPQLSALTGGKALLADGDYFDVPLFLHGYAWEKTAEHIGTYGDFDAQIAWLFLESDLSSGSGFSMRLVAGAAPDTYLHGWIGRRLTCEVETGTYTDCVECLYAVDYGVTYLVNEGSTFVGVCRPLSIGRVIYAPGVGPVAVQERTWIPLEASLETPWLQQDIAGGLIGFGNS